MSTVTIKSTFPEDAAKYVADLIEGNVKFDRWTAIGHGMTLLNYMVDLFGSTSGVKSKALKSARVSKKELAKTLRAACTGVNPGVKTTIPVWLLPVILKLVQGWLDGSKTS